MEKINQKINLLIIAVCTTLLLTLLNSYNIFALGTGLATVVGSGSLGVQGAAQYVLGDGGGLKDVGPIGQGNSGGYANLPAVGVISDDDAVKGSADAPVTIVEFSDYECPFCARHYSQTLPQIISEYVGTGKVKLVFRDFPLGFHPNAQKAAEAAECAGEQGRYWEMHDKIFENQGAIGVANLKEYAAELGLGTAAFDTCLDSGAMAGEVRKDIAEGSSYGVTGTPAFFINRTLVSGAQPFSEFQRVIEAELAKQVA